MELHFHGNNCYTETNEAQELDAGAGLTGKLRGDGLYDVSGSATLQYPTVDAANRLKGVRSGKHSVVICPMGNVAGQPKHAGYLRIASTALDGQSVAKTPVNIALQFEQAELPTVNIFDGGTV
jgi:hypothetical protein